MELLIKKPYISKIESKSRLIFEIVKDEIKYPLYFEVDSKYEQYLTDELSDSCLVCVLLYAMEKGLNIKCEGEISERLYNQLKNYLIPAISKNIKRYKNIEIIAKVSNIEFKGNAVGTGLSCGVDSFYSVLKNLEPDKNNKYRLTHLCFFNAGATGMFGGEEARKTYQERMRRFSKVAEELNCEFFTCDSNMNEFLKQEHEMTHVFRTLSIPLAMQKMFNLYYFSSSYEYSEFKFTDFDPSYYDILTMPNLSNQNIRFELVGGETTRLGKVEYISKYDITQRELNVCIGEVENCGKCRKCRRTMLDLYLIDKLKDYKDVFDIDEFYKNKRKIFWWAIRNKWRVDMPEIVRELRKKHEISIIDYIIAFLTFPFYACELVYSKIKFKLWRKKILEGQEGKKIK